MKTIHRLSIRAAVVPPLEEQPYNIFQYLACESVYSYPKQILIIFSSVDYPVAIWDAIGSSTHEVTPCPIFLNPQAGILQVLDVPKTFKTATICIYENRRDILVNLLRLRVSPYSVDGFTTFCTTDHPKHIHEHHNQDTVTRW